ncbi:dihydrofolate reductase family protein [Conexibacter woesei]|uniref:Bifunctional deaminase-reductase domain protein n=1 Tax=Conexibacter woesei (strain DSM 14684 / CCUG 47730 / CIP 108061 / JCM 11494 / NBRC 100937 / ID131577) TaxID=469383 RepID=D3F760_CONWI|nr:dihydrofolate reductase family protein [Conexibacter woesei]ADB48831.1 bifunctional deaminase-reductase domain protein [Conexibacter woesei DSM 14684]
MTAVTASMMMTLDGFVAGPNVRVPDNPGGDGGERLHEWIAGLASWRERQGLEGGERNADDDLVRAWFDATGAVVMGRLMFDTGEQHWGEDPPFRAPVFVLTNRSRPHVVKQGGTSYTFVTDGIESALAQARAAAGERNVDVAGGADTVQQFIRAGLLDELHLHVLPVLFGEGVRLLDRLGPGLVELEPVHVIEGDGATHLKYAFPRRGATP